MFLLWLYQQEKIKNYENISAKDLKDQLIGMNIKQKVRIKIQQMDTDIFFNQILLEWINCLFKFIQIKIPMLRDLKLKDFAHRKT